MRHLRPLLVLALVTAVLAGDDDFPNQRDSLRAARTATRPDRR